MEQKGNKYVQLFNGQSDYEKRLKAAKAARRNKAKIGFVPVFIAIVANLVVLSLDYRVWEGTYALTQSHPLSAFSLLCTGFMFIVWFDFAYQYALASDDQRKVAITMAILAGLSAGGFALLDYVVAVDPTGLSAMFADPMVLFTVMVILTVLHAGALFYWYSIDEGIKRKSERERQKAQMNHRAGIMNDVAEILTQAETVLSKQSELEQKYGKEAAQTITNALLGIREIDEGKDLDGNGKIGSVTNVNIQAPATGYAADVDAVNPRRVNSPKE